MQEAEELGKHQFLTAGQEEKCTAQDVMMNKK